MPDLPISSLPSLAVPEPSDAFAIVNNSITKKTTVQSVGSSIFTQISSSIILPSQTGSFTSTGSFNSFTQSVNSTTGSLTPYYGAFYHTASMYLALGNTPSTMSLSVIDLSVGVSLSGSYGEIIKITNPGVYNIQFSAQLDKTDSQNTTAYIWLSRTGSDVANTNTAVTLGGGSGDASVAAWNFFVSASANDWYQLKWGATRNNAVILYNSSSTVGPVVPSLILTVNKVG